MTCVQFSVSPTPDIQLNITQIIDGVDTYFNTSNIDVCTSNISDIAQSLSVSGTFSLSKGVIKIVCEVSNFNGNDSVTTFVKPCSKFQ